MNTITKPLKKELSAQFYRGNRAMLVLAVFAALGKGSLNLILSWVLQQLIDAASGLPEQISKCSIHRFGLSVGAWRRGLRPSSLRWC